MTMSADMDIRCLQVIPVAGDGNCLFHALAWNEEGSSSDSLKARPFQ